VNRLNEPLSEVKLNDLNGNTVNVRDYTGKKLLIYMWASW
jgi:peroxiredoxin